MRTTGAESWNFDVSDSEDHGYMDIEYNCPYCFCDGGVLVYVTRNDGSLEEANSGAYEAEFDCEYCGKKIRVICDLSSRV